MRAGTHQTQRPIATGELDSAYVERAQVVNVSAQDYSVDFITEKSMRYYGDVPFSCPYTHSAAGEGAFFMPEVGATCWVCWPSDDSFPFILGYAPPVDMEGRWRGNRRNMNPGDFYVGTRDGNGVVIRRGGVVQVMATPLAQRMYLPINNIIRDWCQNYELHAFGGDLTWEVHRPETNDAGDKTTTWTLKAKEKATDKAAVMELTAGHHEDSETALQMKIYADGTEEHTQNLQLTVKKSGEVKWETQDSFLVSAQKNVELAATENMKLSAQQEAMLSGVQGVKIESSSGGIVVSAPSSNIELGAGIVITPDGTVTLGGEGAEPAVKGTALLAFLSSHTHPINGAVAGATTSPTAGIAASKTFVV